MAKRKRKQPRKQPRKPYPKLNLTWPSRDKPVQEYTVAEATAVAIHPMVCGIGSCPKFIHDADYIAACVREIKVYGLKQFAGKYIELLQMTDRFPWAVPHMAGAGKPAVPNCPDIKTEEGRRLQLKLPLPSVGRGPLAPGGITPELVGEIMLNPVYCGLGPFPQIIPGNDYWVVAFMACVGEDGLVQTLVNLLFVLRTAFGAYGVSYGQVPVGYTIRDIRDDPDYDWDAL